MLFRNLIPVAFLALPLLAGAQQPDPFDDPGKPEPVSASLVSEQKAIVPGKTFTLGVRIDHAPEWHTYWRNPGGIGQATTFKWKLPEGFTAGETQWPVPIIKPYDDGPMHLHEKTAYFLADITAPASLKPGDKVDISVTVDWLRCHDMEGCVPGGGNFKISLPAAASAETDAALKTAFDAVRKDQPVPLSQWKTSVTASGASWVIKAEPGEGAAADPGKLHFLDAASVIVPDEQKWKKDGSAFVLEIAKREDAAGTPQGYILAGASWVNGSKVSVLPVGTASPAPPPDTKPDTTAAAEAGNPDIEAQIATIRGWGVRELDGSKSDALTWPLALLFALLGGMILNLMPCVFPVLGIKILGFVRQSGEHPGAVKKHGLAYAGGILASMMVLAGILIALRAFGEALGWGFQLQNPVFLLCLIVLVFAVSLELAGLFEMGTSLTSVGAELQEQSGYKGSFFSGLLTVLLATPCTGPFMGPALGFALSKDTPISLVVAIFFVLSIGLALPYVYLSWHPALVKKLPRPGAWMETFKQVMSFPMFATCGWLITVFTASTGRTGLLYVLFALVCLALTLWLYGRFSTPVAKPRSKRLALIFGVLFLGSGGWLAWSATQQEAPPVALGKGELAYSPKTIIERRAKGLTTVVDFWAEWCVLCESNKKLAFERNEFVEAVREHNAVFMVADWTKKDADIGKFLAAYNQGGIPFALVFPPTGPAIKLPAALTTPGEAIAGLVEAKKQAAGGK